MWSSIYHWLYSEIRPLDSVLKSFNRVHDELLLFIHSANGLSSKKREQAVDLNAQAERHENDSRQASNILDNIRKILER